MSLFENFPYTNLHNLNLDWIIAEIERQKNFFDNELIPLIDEKISQAVVNATMDYRPATEAIVFTLTGGN